MWGGAGVGTHRARCPTPHISCAEQKERAHSLSSSHYPRITPHIYIYVRELYKYLESRKLLSALYGES